jgi:Tol biopolymer transport system component
VFRTTRQFYIALGSLILVLGVALGIVLATGDSAGQPLKASMSFLPEGAGGLPQVAIQFEPGSLPERSAAEAALELAPANQNWLASTPLAGDFSWDGATLLFTPASRLLPDTFYHLRLKGGLKLAKGGRLSYDPAEWDFRTPPARLLYLKRQGKATNLWLQEPGNEPRQLTFETERQVLEYTLSPGGQRLVYSLQETNALDASLWLINLAGSPPGQPLKLVSEKNVRATAPRWSPGGDLIAYERRLVFDSGGFSPAQLWLVKPDGTSLAPLYGGADRVGVDLAWVQGGDQAFFWEPRRQALGLFNFGGEPEWNPMPKLQPSSLAPSPDGKEVIIARYDFSGAEEKQVLWRLARPDKTKAWQPDPHQPVTPPGYNDHDPVWSPDGRLVAFTRQGSATGPDRASRLWVFDTQTGQTRPLLELSQAEAGFSYGGLSWSSDGQKVFFERYPAGVRSGTAQSEIWEASANGQNLRRLVSGAFGAQLTN